MLKTRSDSYGQNHRHQTVAKSMYVLVKLKPLVKEEKVSMPMVTMRKEF
jgi:hypothetical protein